MRPASWCRCGGVGQIAGAACLIAVAPDLHATDEDELDERPFAEINVTPLVDVMLVLLVIFMMAAPLMMQGVRIDLPKSGGTSLGSPAKPLVVSMSRDGGLRLRDEATTLDALETRARSLRAAEGDAVVYVRADRGVAYGDVMNVIGRLGTGGFSHISLLSLPEASR